MLLLISGIVFTNLLRTDGRTDRRTDIASYRDAYAASKNGINALKRARDEYLACEGRGDFKY